MNTPKDKDISIRLLPHQVKKLVGLPSGTTVVCDKGIVWLTESDILQDFTLKAGKSVVIKKKSDVLIESMNESDLHVFYPN